MSISSISSHVFLIDAPFQGIRGVLGTYLVKGERSILIDPGPTVSIPYVEQAIKKTCLTNNLSCIIPTHIDLDHSGGTWKLMDKYPSSTLLVNPRGVQHMIEPERLIAGATALFGSQVQSYGEIRGTPLDRTYESKDNQEIDLGGVTAKIIWTPGHSSHHQCIYIPEDHVLIAGDAAGFYYRKTGIIMPTTPPPFNPLKAIDILNRLIKLSPDIIGYGHFGATDNAVEKLIAHKEQIKVWLHVVKQNWKPGSNLKELYEAIREADSYAKKSREFNNGTKERSPLINLQGFIQYIEREKAKNEISSR